MVDRLNGTFVQVSWNDENEFIQRNHYTLVCTDFANYQKYKSVHRDMKSAVLELPKGTEFSCFVHASYFIGGNNYGTTSPSSETFIIS